ncbi:MAG: hypothetical protein ACYS1A_17750 [Planctomycetota bacterium]|jgi:hypothetical protein
MKRRKRKRGKCRRCNKITTHTEQIIESGSIDYELAFFCIQCTKETPEG